MPAFDYTFTVDAPLTAVADFHHDTSVLKRLTPPPLFVQIHRFDPMADGAEAEFTMWFGPIPVRWQAIHSEVDAGGFTDTQLRGPLKKWIHTHRFTAVTPTQTRVSEHIDYEYKDGWRGLLSRLFFSPPALTFLFTYRKLVTRRGVR